MFIKMVSFTSNKIIGVLLEIEGIRDRLMCQ